MTPLKAALLAGLLLLGSAAPGYSQGARCPGLCQGQTLAPFLSLLEDARSRPVHILEIGDSHSANENFIGAWRDILQARYGDGGRGVMPPGRPWAGYVTRQVTVAQSGDWSQESILTARRRGRSDIVFGVSGFRFSAPPDGGKMSLQADPGHSFRRFVVCAQTGPGQGTLTLGVGPGSRAVALQAAEPGVVCPEVEAASPQVSATATVSGGPAEILSWASFTGGAGVIVSNLGVPGTELLHLGLNGNMALSAELKAYAPDLIVIAFGTNEGFAPHFSTADYEETLRQAIRRLRALAPDTPLLLLGAPDAQSRSPVLLHNEDQGRKAFTGRGGWFSPPALEDVRAVQRRVSAAEHVALWDWADRMGGVGAAGQWPVLSPPLMRGDHVHYTAQGGLRLAERLQADLDHLGPGG